MIQTWTKCHKTLSRLKWVNFMWVLIFAGRQHTLPEGAINSIWELEIAFIFDLKFMCSISTKYYSWKYFSILLSLSEIRSLCSFRANFFWLNFLTLRCECRWPISSRHFDLTQFTDSSELRFDMCHFVEILDLFGHFICIWFVRWPPIVLLSVIFVEFMPLFNSIEHTDKRQNNERNM